MEKIIQHTEDAGADPEVAKLVIDDEATYALVEMLLARIDALRGENRVIERVKERVEAENVKLREEVRKLWDDQQRWGESPPWTWAGEQSWRKRKVPEPRERYPRPGPLSSGTPMGGYNPP